MRDRQTGWKMPGVVEVAKTRKRLMTSVSRDFKPTITLDYMILRTSILLQLGLMIVLLSGCASLESPDPELREIAVDNTTDETVLLRVALEDESFKVSQAAMKRLKDQELLGRVALESKHHPVSYKAVDQITNQMILLKIVMESKSEPIQAAAAGKLTDQESLGTILIKAYGLLPNSFGPSPAGIAASKLTDPGVAAKVALNAKGASVRKAVIGMVRDQTVLEKVASGDADWEVRLEAANSPYFSKQDGLKNRMVKEALKMAMKSPDWKERLKVVRLPACADQEILEQAARRDSKWLVRKEAVAKLKDEAVVAQIAMQDQDFEVQAAAKYQVAKIRGDDSKLIKRDERKEQLSRNWGKLKRDLTWEEADNVLHVVSPEDPGFEFMGDMDTPFGLAQDHPGVPISIVIGPEPSVMVLQKGGGESLFNFQSSLSVNYGKGIAGIAIITQAGGEPVAYVIYNTNPVFGPGKTMVLSFIEQKLSTWKAYGFSAAGD